MKVDHKIWQALIRDHVNFVEIQPKSSKWPVPRRILLEYFYNETEGHAMAHWGDDGGGGWRYQVSNLEI